MDDDLRDLWTEGEEPMIEIDMDALRREGEGFRRTIRRRNVVELVAASVVVVVFAWVAASGAFPVILRVSSALNALGAVVVGAVIWTRAAPATAPFARNTAEFVEQRREELLQQARLAATVPVWYLGPFVPGMVGFAIHRPFMGVVTLVTFGGIAALNLRAARSLRAEAERLGRLG